MGIDFTDVSAYVDGELDAERREAVRKQIESSPVYAEELRRMEQAHALLGKELEDVAYHDALMAKIQTLDSTLERERPVVRWAWRGLAAAAAIALAAVAADYAGLVDLGPNAPSTGAPAQPAPASGWKLALGAASGAIPVAGALDAAAEVQTRLAELRLVGTVGGDTPAAVFSAGSGGLIAAALGRPVLTGAELVDVRYGQAVIERRGERTLIAVPAANRPLELPGAWQFRFANTDAVMLDCRIALQGDAVAVSLLDGRVISRGNLQGAHLVIPLPTDHGLLQFEGDLRAHPDRLYLAAVLETPNAQPELIVLEGHPAGK